jgi:hypothetical protein
MRRRCPGPPTPTDARRRPAHRSVPPSGRRVHRRPLPASAGSRGATGHRASHSPARASSPGGFPPARHPQRPARSHSSSPSPQHSPRPAPGFRPRPGSQDTPPVASRPTPGPVPPVARPETRPLTGKSPQPPAPNAATADAAKEAPIPAPGDTLGGTSRGIGVEPGKLLARPAVSPGVSASGFRADRLPSRPPLWAGDRAARTAARGPAGPDTPGGTLPPKGRIRPTDCRSES